jgi:NAD(P)-dependent dehydrogenase (short-subunit alcohol dehydrogenase family)
MAGSRAEGPLNVFVSGGSSGIGRHIVQTLCERGHHVLFTYYSNEAGARQLERKYKNAKANYCDQGQLNR